MEKRLAVVILIIISSYSISAQTLKFTEVSEVKALKRGKEYSIKWMGGAVDQMIKIELYDHSEKVQSWDETLNDGEHVIKLNSKLRPDKNYAFKILAGEEVVSSQQIQIKRKLPLAITISTAIIVPGVVIMFSTGDNGEERLDAAPTPPTGN